MSRNGIDKIVYFCSCQLVYQLHLINFIFIIWHWHNPFYVFLSNDGIFCPSTNYITILNINLIETFCFILHSLLCSSGIIYLCYCSIWYYVLQTCIGIDSIVLGKSLTKAKLCYFIAGFFFIFINGDIKIVFPLQCCVMYIIAICSHRLWKKRQYSI